MATRCSGREKSTEYLVRGRGRVRGRDRVGVGIRGRVGVRDGV